MDRRTLSEPDQRPETSSITLSRLLNHLESQLLAPDADPIRNRFELNKTTGNFEYARTLLLRLEHDSTSIKVASRKQATQADLLKKRETTKRLQARLQELRLQVAEREAAEDAEDETEDEDEDEAEGWQSYAPAVPAHAGIDTEPSPAQTAAAELASTLRARRPAAPQSPAATSTGASPSLFPSSTSAASSPSAATATATADRETLLTAHRAEQTAITDSLLALARDLKLSATGFQSGIAQGRDVLERAAAGLDANAAGLDAAGKRMGVLRRMTEGKGWWGRLKLYALIAGLWVVALFVVAFLPKLRFSPRF